MVTISNDIPSIDKFGHFISNFQVGSGNSDFHDVYFSFATWWPFVLELTCWNISNSDYGGRESCRSKKK